MRGRVERLGEDPCSSLVCIRQTAPAGPVQITAAFSDSAATPSATAPVNAPPCQSPWIGPRCEPGSTLSGPFSSVTSSTIRSAVTMSALLCGVKGKSWCHFTSVCPPGSLELILVWCSLTAGPMRSATQSVIRLSAVARK